MALSIVAGAINSSLLLLSSWISGVNVGALIDVLAGALAEGILF
jgi:hypothetical protein